jgi:hypothetical protein
MARAGITFVYVANTRTRPRSRRTIRSSRVCAPPAWSNPLTSLSSPWPPEDQASSLPDPARTRGT